MKVSELFYSLQGEGILAGVPSVFVRLAGCPLRCRWCDTKCSWDETAGSEYSAEGLAEAVSEYPTRFVVVTGGEPMIHPELPRLARALKEKGKHITIETAGIAFVPDIACDLMSISPKLSNSTPTDPRLVVCHDDSRLDLAVLAELLDNYEYQLKFVVDREEDLQEICETIERIGRVDRAKVMLMPQARTRDELVAKSSMVAEMCKKTGFAFSSRLHVLLWDNQRQR